MSREPRVVSRAVRNRGTAAHASRLTLQVSAAPKGDA